MYLSSCKSVDVRIDIVKCEDGFLIVVKMIKKWVSISVKVRSKTIVKITTEQNSCSTSFKWQKGQIQRFSVVFGAVCPPKTSCRQIIVVFNISFY